MDNTMKKVCLVATVMAVSMTSSANLLAPVDFESDSMGSVPTSSSPDLTPTTPQTLTKVVVVDSAANTAGTGKGVRFLDNDGTASVRLQYDFVADAASHVSAVQIDLKFAQLSAGPGIADYIALSVGEYGVDQSSQTKRFLDTRLLEDTTVDFRSSGVGGSDYGNTILASGNALRIAVNDFDSQSVNYTGQDNNTYSLAPNTAAYWLNGTLRHTALLEEESTGNGTVLTSENNLGRLGLATVSGDVNMDYVFDDISVTQIPEPATILLVGGTGLGMFFARRRVKA